MKFPKPIFDELKLHYQKDPESVHDCSRLYRKDLEQDVYTSAIRMSEALVLANRLIRTRADISALNSVGGTGHAHLLGRYGYRTNLCPHGLARGARDLAYFLQDHWGRPSHAFRDFDYRKQEQDGPAEGAPAGQLTELDAIKSTLSAKIGIICFFSIEDFPAQGHVDLWDKKRTVARAYWWCRKIWFWKLD